MTHAPAGYSPIPGSRHDGYRKMTGAGWVYWYESAAKAEQAFKRHAAIAKDSGEIAAAASPGSTEYDEARQREAHHDELATGAWGAMTHLVRDMPIPGSDDYTPPAGYEPIPGSPSMGHHNPTGKTGAWYPSQRHAKDAEAHHKRMADHHRNRAANVEPGSQAQADATQYARWHAVTAMNAQSAAKRPQGAQFRPLAKAERGAVLALGLLRLFAALQRGADTLVPLKKGMPDALVLVEPGAIEVLSKWTQEGFACSVRRAPGGLSYLTIEGGGLALPYHAAVGGVSEARKAADHALPLLRKGLAPREGVFRRSGALRQGPRTGYAVHR